jgi:hypothetical protein
MTSSRAPVILCWALVAACAQTRPLARPLGEDLPPAVASGPETSRALARQRAAEAQALLEALRAVPRARTVSGDAKAFVDAPERGGRYPLFFAVQAPGSLRLDALTPLGDPAVVLVAHEGRFGLYDVREGAYFRGAATAKNLARLLPARLDAAELVALLTGGAPELAGASPLEVRDQEGTRWLVTSTLPAGTATLRGERQEVRLGEGLRVLEVRRLWAGGPADGSLTLHVQLDEFEGKVPTRIRIAAPADKISIDLKLKKITVDHAPPPSAFGLAPPAGVRVVELD